MPCVRCRLSVYLKQVCVQLPTPADSVTLPAFAAARRAAVRSRATVAVWRPGGRRNLPTSFAHWAHSSKPAAAVDRWDGLTSGHRTVT